MGLFSGIKKAFNVGGVKVKVDAPSSAKTLGGTVPVTVTLTTKIPQKVNSVTVELVRRVDTSDPNQHPEPDSVLAKMSKEEVIQVNPGETKTLQFDMPISIGQAVKETAPGEAGQMIGGILQKVQAVAGAMSSKKYRHVIRASADVDGVSMDPADETDIMILQPGQIGGSWSI